MDNKVLATVEGREITERDLMNSLSRFPRERQSYLMSEEGKGQLLEQLISFELLYNYGKENDLEKEEDYIARVEEAKKEILTQTAINKMLQNVDVTDAEIKAYYEVNSHIFKNEESVTARHILVDTLEKAQQVKEEIVSGLSFEDAARKYSSCPSKEQGGSLGSFGRGMMVPEFENAAFEIAEGVVSEPVKTQFGYHLILVEGRTKSQEKPYEEVKELIRSHMVQEKQNSLYIDHVNGLKEKYSIEIK
jgi:peptidyl-prolyl cis-trans isomerase C